MKRWKNLLWVGLGLCAVFAAAGAVTSVPVLAQAVRAALVRDVDNPAYEPVRTAFFLSFSSGQGYITQDGLIVPAGKRLVIENASVWTIAGTPARITGVWVRPKVQPSPPVYLLLDPAENEFRSINGGANTVAAYNRTLRAYFNPGDQLTAEAFFEGATFAQVNIYLQGYYVTLP
jgi:hypothetical protein